MQIPYNLAADYLPPGHGRHQCRCMAAINGSEDVCRWDIVAAQVWTMTRATRNRLHGHLAHCPATANPYLAATSGQVLPVDPRCESAGCLDHVHDVVAATMFKLRAANPTSVDDWPGYVATVVRHELIDMRRRHRVSLGFPAKPARDDGVPGRVVARLRQEPHEVRRTWLLTLFRIMRSYPFVEGRDNASWPLDGLTLEKSSIDGVARDVSSGAARCEIRQDIAWVLRVARETVGYQWVYDSIILPLRCYRTCGPLPDQLAE